nr:hypothetical protein [Kibdelosporangium sp. MJ126-NF4]CEL14104.1 hypothetical protein [Kibdelosporangium sp. MJ126-NF4]CTQ88471.1 hypothetical protein [Kibdelosporangium sp. MJ126-NF4]
MTTPIPNDTTAVLTELVSEWRLVWNSLDQPGAPTADRDEPVRPLANRVSPPD